MTYSEAGVWQDLRAAKRVLGEQIFGRTKTFPHFRRRTKTNFKGIGCLVLSPAVDSILRDADQHYNDQSQDKLRPMVEEGREVLGHYRLLQRLLIVSDEVGDGEDKWYNWIEEQKSQWVDKKFPPDKSEESKSKTGKT